jgi:hypothetical protein
MIVIYLTVALFGHMHIDRPRELTFDNFISDYW